jgi:hypothetical protein
VSARHRPGAGPVIDSKAEAIAELMLEVAQCFFRIRAVGQKSPFRPREVQIIKQILDNAGHLRDLGRVPVGCG